MASRMLLTVALAPWIVCNGWGVMHSWVIHIFILYKKIIINLIVLMGTRIGIPGKTSRQTEKVVQNQRNDQGLPGCHSHGIQYTCTTLHINKGNGEALLSKWEITAISHKIIYRCNQMHRRFCLRVECHALMAQPRKSMICCRRLARGVPGGRAGSPRAWETTCAAAAAELQDVM